MEKGIFDQVEILLEFVKIKREWKTFLASLPYSYIFVNISYKIENQKFLNKKISQILYTCFVYGVDIEKSFFNSNAQKFILVSQKSF